MARNLRKYGYGPNRSSDMPRRLGLTLPGGIKRFARPSRTPAEQRAAIEPMTAGNRTRAYLLQNSPGQPKRVGWDTRSGLTRRQLRRLRHKSKLGAVAWARG